jgi:hypothetical protein
MLIPDSREIWFYDINNILSVEPDMIPHYYTILMDKLRLLDDNVPRPICLACNTNLDCFEHEGTLYCGNGWAFDRSINQNGEFVLSNLRRKTYVPHEIIYETLRESMNRVLQSVFDRIQEPSGYTFTLLDLEDYLVGQPRDGLFETKHGDVTKANIQSWLYPLKKICMSRVMELRQDIRFSSAMRTPAIKVA